MSLSFHEMPISYHAHSARSHRSENTLGIRNGPKACAAAAVNSIALTQSLVDSAADPAMDGRFLRRSVAWMLLIAPIVAVVLGLAACGGDGVVGPPLPSDAQLFSPPGVYSTWWNMTQACSGLTGSLAAVTWYTTDEVIHEPNSGDVVLGYWSSASNQIVLTTASVTDGATVRHEMLHALLRQGGHPRNQFLGKCAGTVPCEEPCIRDAGPYPTPPESPIHITLESTDLTVDVEPRNPTPGQDGGFFTITVMAHNRSTHWASVTPSLAQDDTTSTFSFDVRSVTSGGFTGGNVALDPSERIFAPGETKKQVFDFRIGDSPFGNQLQSGNYTIRGGYSDYWSADSAFVIGP